MESLSVVSGDLTSGSLGYERCAGNRCAGLKEFSEVGLGCYLVLSKVKTLVGVGWFDAIYVG